MILKSKTHKNSKALSNTIDYVLRDSATIKKNGKTIVVKHNMPGRNADDYKQQFIENLENSSYKHKNQVAIHHLIISFHPDADKKILTTEALKDITRKVIKLRGDKAQYIASFHKDKEHVHIHLLMSANEISTFKSMRMSKKEFSEFQQAIEKYQKEYYPELDKSIVGYGDPSKKKV